MPHAFGELLHGWQPICSRSRSIRLPPPPFEARAQKKLTKTGTPARATCTQFSQQWRSEGSAMWGASAMTLQVRPETGEPYEWPGTMWVRVARYNEIPGEIEGRDLPLRYDPADPQKVAVDWDAAAQEAQAGAQPTV